MNAFEKSVNFHFMQASIRVIILTPSRKLSNTYNKSQISIKNGLLFTNLVIQEMISLQTYVVISSA